MSHSYVNLYNKETKTQPLVVHANGNSKHPGKDEVWEKIRSFYNQSNPKKEQLCDDLTIVTWKGGRFSSVKTVLEESCDKFGVSLKILPWPDTTNFWEGTVKAKIHGTHQAIQRGEIKTKYMMTMDAGDVIFLKHPNIVLEEFLKTYNSYKSVWCTEANDWPRLDLPKYVHYPVLDDLLSRLSKRDREDMKIHGSRFAFLNAGCSTGETQHYVKFYEASMNVCNRMHTVDQAMSRISQFLDPENHSLDSQCQLYQCLYDTTLQSFDVGLVHE